MSALTIDLARYTRLPFDVWCEFNRWLESEGLVDKHIVELTLGEGFVTVERHAVDDEGNRIVNESGDGVVTVTDRFPVSSLPPLGAFL